MKTALPHLRLRARQSGVTLLEMLVSVSILLVLIFGLTAAFNQTEKIFVAGLSQNDTGEGGRLVLDLIRRDLEPANGNFQNVASNAVVAAVALEASPAKQPPIFLTMPLSGVTENVLEKFFLLRQNLSGLAPTNLVGIGYRVLNIFTNGSQIDATAPYVGTLYRFSTENVPAPLLPSVYGYFQQGNSYLPVASPHKPAPGLVDFALTDGSFANEPDYLIVNQFLTQVLEGVIHFQVNFYDRFGQVMTNETPAGLVANYSSYAPPSCPNYIQASASLPALVEVELGVLDPPVVEQFKALFPNGQGASDNPAAVRQFLGNHSGNIHYYRTQIPIRTSLTAPLP